MDRGPRLLTINKHVDSNRVPEPESGALSRLDNAGKIGAIHRGVHVAGEARPLRVALKDVNERRHSSDDPVRNSGPTERRVKAPHALQKLLHVDIVSGRRQHSHFDCSAAYSSRAPAGTLVPAFSKIVLVSASFSLFWRAASWPSERPVVHRHQIRQRSLSVFLRGRQARVATTGDLEAQIQDPAPLRREEFYD